VSQQRVFDPVARRVRSRITHSDWGWSAATAQVSAYLHGFQLDAGQSSHSARS